MEPDHIDMMNEDELRDELRKLIARPSSCTCGLHCSASLQAAKQLTDAMHHHIQEANRYALELRKYAMPKLEHDIKTPNSVLDRTTTPAKGK